MSLADLPPLREVVAAHDLGARKQLGQHFLFDLNLTAKIARAAGPLEGRAVVEVGPGPGGLTRALLAAGAHVLAIEKDPRFRPALDEIAAAAAGRLTVVEADALTADEPALLADAFPDRPALVVANLPYNVGTPLLVKWLSGARWWEALVLMFQKEVADRVAASPGCSAYGRLAVLARLRAAPAFAFEVPARAFTPPPKVDSAVVRLDPRADPFADVDTLERVTAAAFGQRRKMLRRSLKPMAGAAGLTVEAWLEAAGLPGEARPETIAPEGFAALARGWRRPGA
ncbi:MAG: 16S rRNA (adenine(1518)-N(6)/adenine(1519)-N(6))-dimethyltransferase RsmA [Caulobacterales bacterium]|nr:16S rRNA (adenine(1518)-N(6)/adenine(1519)-N(6))-dimethyltransferase RsmA [Caulobacterales bacterium]